MMINELKTNNQSNKIIEEIGQEYISIGSLIERLNDPFAQSLYNFVPVLKNVVTNRGHFSNRSIYLNIQTLSYFLKSQITKWKDFNPLVIQNFCEIGQIEFRFLPF